MVKVLVIDDSAIAREMISTILMTDSEIEVIGKSSNGKEAIEFLKNIHIKPDIITCDLQMPIMDGFETIEYIMAYQPTPILIVTVLLIPTGRWAERQRKKARHRPRTW